jgi:citrate lyase subunit beta / citryl-CoA lyase
MDAQPSGRRSVLSVPADDPRKIAKALAAGADEVVLDLEDAVATGGKARAREVLESYAWPGGRPALAVRVNGIGTPWFEDDVRAVAGLPVRSIVLPKSESRADVAAVEALLDEAGAELGVQALVETARGVASLPDVVRDRGRLTSLIIGYADLAASLGRRSVDPARWTSVQEHVLWHARAAGLDAVDGPYLGVADDEPFRAAVAAIAGAGFDAKWVIHPRQVEAVNAAFAPTAEAVEHAERVIAALDEAAATGRGAVQLDGQLLDEAMALAARRVLATVER